MDQDTQNPLMKYFRGADVHQILPTRGRFFKNGDIMMSISGEVAVMPMTAADEIILNNPDALLNGDALERLFKSCVPGIHAPRDISVPDMDVLLLAIKLASGGDRLDVKVRCDVCKHEFQYEVSIREILATIVMLREEDLELRINDELVMYLKPYDFYAKTQLDLVSFEEQKLLQHLLDTNMSDGEKNKLFNASFEKYALLNLSLLGHCVTGVQTPGGLVTSEPHIQEFIQKTGRDVARKIRDQLKVISASGIKRDIQVPCPAKDCGNICETEMSFDPSTFFA